MVGIEVTVHIRALTPDDRLNIGTGQLKRELQLPVNPRSRGLYDRVGETWRAEKIWSPVGPEYFGNGGGTHCQKLEPAESEQTRDGFL